MRRALPFIFLAALVVIFIGLIVYANLDGLTPSATIPELNQAEEKWYSSGVLRYRISTDVIFPGERREHEVIVLNGVVSEARIRYWDFEAKAWKEFQPMSLQAAGEVTVPGLFAIIRVELLDDLDRDIQVIYSQNPTYPQRILFGSLSLDGEVVQSTQGEILVTGFEELD